MRKSLLTLLFLPIVALSQNYIDKIDSIITSKFNNGPAVSILISKEFTPVYTCNKGLINIENEIKVDENSRFRIGSITKQFTAVAILKLVEEGKISLDDTIQQYLPNFPPKKQSIEIKHLLSHTSGLPEITEMEIFHKHLMKNGCQPDSLMDYFKDLPLNFTPGSNFQYNNSGYHLLGLIIEKVSGENYNEYISNNLLQVAHMHHTMADDWSKIIKNRVSGYEKKGDEIINATYIDMSIPYSGGNLLSTSIDLNNWYQSLFEYKIISKESLDNATTPYKLIDGSYSNYGYGWFIDSLQGEKLISHEGGINGFLSSVWYIPSTKTLSIILSNCMCNPTVKTAELLTAYAIGKPLPEKTRLVLSEEDLKKYIGVYIMDGEEWTISIKNSELYFQFPNGNGHAIYALSFEEFFTEEWDSKFLFIEKNEKLEFHFIYLGEEIIGYKKILE